MYSLLFIFLVSMFPIAELRGGLPLGISLGVSPLQAYLVSVAGNIAPILPLLLLLKYGIRLLRKNQWMGSVLNRWESRIERRREMVSRYGLWGIVLLVAIPLPITGAWTAALISSVLSIRIRYAFLAICIGVCIAGAIVLSATIGIISVRRIIGGM